jgi:hypothetical protein
MVKKNVGGKKLAYWRVVYVPGSRCAYQKCRTAGIIEVLSAVA